ncbi:MAG: hypothetical protein FJW56_07865 [Actinobacteria bacterium]|nr:hypothetical protein [Actinomycetota bacterium]
MDDGLFQRGDDLKIEYVFFQGDHGSPLLSCCLTPFALGFVGVKGFFWVQIKLTNSKGDILRILEIKDSINYNIFNLWGITSSYNDLLEKNADVISSYIILHFN